MVVEAIVSLTGSRRDRTGNGKKAKLKKRFQVLKLRTIATIKLFAYLSAQSRMMMTLEDAHLMKRFTGYVGYISLQRNK